MSEKKIKLYTHHATMIRLDEHADTEDQHWVVRLLMLPFVMLWSVCFAAGTLVYTVVHFLYTAIRTIVSLPVLVSKFILQSKKTKEPVFMFGHPRRSFVRTLREAPFTLGRPHVLYGLAIFVLLSVGAISVFNSFLLFARGQQLKGQVLGQTTDAIHTLEQGKQLLAAQDTTGARNAFEQAVVQFTNSKKEIDEGNDALHVLLTFVPAKASADNLLNAGRLLSEAAQELTFVYSTGSSLQVTDKGLQGERALQSVVDMQTHIQLAKEKVTQASFLIDRVSDSDIPESKQEQFLQTRRVLSQAVNGLDLLSQFMNMGVRLLSGKKHIVFIFQNNNELRATGGFIGTYGDMVLHDGVIEDLHISSVYDIDGQLKVKIQPPRPMLAVNDTLFFRDANWFASFPLTAQVLSRLYSLETGIAPDMVIGLNPAVVTSLLKVTGPVRLDAYNQTLDSDNFVEATQIQTSIAYNKLDNKPKQMLADFFQVFLGRIATSTGESFLPIFSSMHQSLARGDILLYSKSPELQSYFLDFNWAGQIPQTDRDYLLISRSNIGGTKTDTYIAESVSLISDIDTDGSVVNTLRIARTNPLPNSPTMTNKSFIRVFVPEGSELVSSEGYTPDHPDVNFKLDGTTDPQIQAWQNTTHVDAKTGTLIGTESGKTFFGNWYTLAGGESKNIVIRYKLPFVLHDLDHMSLVYQRQPGSVPAPVSYQLSFAGRTMEWNNFSPVTLDPTTVLSNTPGEYTEFFGSVLRKE